MKKAKITEAEAKEPVRVYIEYRENRSGGAAHDPDDEWTSYDDIDIEVKFIRLYREPPKNRFFYDSIKLPDERMLKMNKLFLAVVRYGKGDTFGHTNGAWYIVGIAPTWEIAQAMLDEETAPGAKNKPWQGYFESLESTEIHPLDLV